MCEGGNSWQWQRGCSSRPGEVRLRPDDIGRGLGIVVEVGEGSTLRVTAVAERQRGAETTRNPPYRSS